MPKDFSITYPRRPLIRSAFRTLARATMSLLTRPRITGQENLPKKGPMILAANHISSEVLMLLAYTPWPIEVIVASDVPVRPKYLVPLYRCYGILPINRGSVDRSGLIKVLDILKQGGVVGIFPQGGLWDTMHMRAHSGVAWLSYKANVPVLPIGFGGMRDAQEAFSRFRRPKMIMNVGKPIPPVDIEATGKQRKAALKKSTEVIMARIEELIPEEEKRNWPEDERFDFELIVQDAKGREIKVPDGLLITFTKALGQFFHRTAILDTMSKNLALPVQALQRLDTFVEPKQIADAAQAVLDFLQNNSQFLGYRFGYKMAQAMQTGITQLRNVALWAAKRGYRLRLRPIRRYRRWRSNLEIVEEAPRQ